jgi:glycosyltransferase involved in cell wall biosynthesis
LIYICIPTHNEQQTVGVVLWKLRQVLTDFPRDYQLLVADDASTDKTTDVLEPYTRVLPLTVIRSEQRQGYAASLEMLLREAVRRSEYPKRDVVVTLQADFSEEPDDVVSLIKRMEAGADVALGLKVSTVPYTRMRRLARKVSRFFTRRQSWPEGVLEPFDGYRAYRLYAIKRAMEERPGSRLLRYDGWAGHAELLRAVLPHARRVETVEVEDRYDRLQRPRRERPIAAALQVRAMSSGSEPPGLVGIEELDRVAATASRSRAKAQPRLNGDGRGNVSETRDRRPSSQESRGRSRPERNRSESGRGEGRSASAGEVGGRKDSGRPDRSSARSRSGSSDAAGQEPRRRTRREPGSASTGDAGAAAAGAAEAADAPERERRPRRPRRSSKDVGQAAASPEELELTAQAGDSTDLEAAVAEEVVEGDAPRPKKRRRRRRSRSGRAGSSEAGSEGESDGTVDGDAADDGDPADGAIAGESPEGLEGHSEEGDGTGDRKRRRRGGRRGGRGRRRPARADGSSDDGDVEGSQSSGVADVEAGEPPVQRTDAAVAAPVDTGDDK